jgi:hypothetical protein
VSEDKKGVMGVDEGDDSSTSGYFRSSSGGSLQAAEAAAVSVVSVVAVLAVLAVAVPVVAV